MKITSAENNSSPIRFQLYFHVQVDAIGLSFFFWSTLFRHTRNSWSVFAIWKFSFSTLSIGYTVLFHLFLYLRVGIMLRKIRTCIPRWQTRLQRHSNLSLYRIRVSWMFFKAQIITIYNIAPHTSDFFPNTETIVWGWYAQNPLLRFSHCVTCKKKVQTIRIYLW